MSRLKTETGWTSNGIATDLVTQVGSYIMLADAFAAFIQIAKSNPEFACVPSAPIEIRPIKSKDIKTGYTYPNSQIN